MANIVVDLDGVLCEDISYEEDPDYSNRKKSIYFEDLNTFLFFMRYERREIIIHTSRYEEDREVTEKWLNDNDVIFDKLIMGKPKADLYIDDKAVNIAELKAWLEKIKTLKGDGVVESNKS